jgi:hypothetical protein
MVDLTKLPNSKYASSIDEAMILVRRCAEPHPAGDLVKAAIRRASKRLEILFSRIRQIWSGDARRIDAAEMDRLRRGAEYAEISQAVAAMEFLSEKLLSSPSSASYPAITNLCEALLSAAAMLSENHGPQKKPLSTNQQGVSAVMDSLAAGT